MSLRRRFLQFDTELAGHGVPPLTQWWRRGIGRWLDAYEAGGALELWACVGRGAAKSTALYKLGTFLSLFGDYNVPPGERHYAVILSRLKEEASKGIDIIGHWLALLGVEHRVAGDVIEFVDIPRGVRVVAASVAATSGWRAFFVGKDERSKWPFGAAEGQDADEIDTSAAAMTATHPRAAVVCFGSAWGSFGGFFDAITSGTDDAKHVLGPTPTWIAAPHIKEADLRKKERDPRRFAREYECVFQAGVNAVFDTDAVERAFRNADLDIERGGAAIVVIDASSGKKDSWTWGLCRLVQVRGETRFRLLFEHIDGIEGRFWDQVDGSEIVRRISSFARSRHATAVHADQREALMLQSAFRTEGLRFVAHDWTAASKPEAVERVRRWLADGSLVLPNHEKLRREMLSFEEKITSSGAFTFGARGSGHDDYVSLLLTAALAEIEGQIPRPQSSTESRGFWRQMPHPDDMSAGFDGIQ